MTTLVYALVSKEQIKDIVEDGKIKNILISYWFLRKNPVKILSYTSKLDIDMLMLDSGAFSAWKNGINISLFDYIDFIKEYHSYFTHIVCLDVIDDPILSEVNHLIMQQELKDYDLTIIPVFHSGEPFSVLDYMIEKGYTYIGISPNNNWSEKSKREWLNRVFSQYDFEKLGIKTHGFGYQSINGLFQFPMTTADSTTWVVGQMFGEIIDEIGRIRYSDWGKGDERHIDNIPGGNSSFVKNICESIGLNIEDLRIDGRARNKFNIEALRVIAERENGIVSFYDDIFEDGGYSGDFSENKIKEAYTHASQMGRKYTGGGEHKNYIKKRIRKGQPNKDKEFLF